MIGNHGILRCFVGWRLKVNVWNEVMMTWQNLKLGYLLCVLHLLESGKDAFHNEIHLTFDYIDNYDNECMDITVTLCFQERHRGEYKFMYHERWFTLNGLGCSEDDTIVWLHGGIFLWRWLGVWYWLLVSLRGWKWWTTQYW
jgi:hypothetical protein